MILQLEIPDDKAHVLDSVKSLLIESGGRLAIRSESDMPPVPEDLTLGPITVRPSRGEVFVNGAPVELSVKESAVLELLMRRANTVVPHTTLLKLVWGCDEGPQVIKSVVFRLRRKVGLNGLISAVRGRGYMLQAPTNN